MNKSDSFIPNTHVPQDVREMMDGLMDGAVLLNESGQILAMNHAGAQLLGRSEEACYGQEMHQLTRCQWEGMEGGCPVHTELFYGRLMRTGRGQLAHRSGVMIPVSFTCRRMTVGSESRLVMSIRDLRPIEQNNEDLRRARLIREECPFPIVEVNSKGQMEYANPAMVQLLAELDFVGNQNDALPPHCVDLIRANRSENAVCPPMDVRVGDRHLQWFFFVKVPGISMRGYAVDLTKSKTYECQLKATTLELRRAVASAQEQSNGKQRLLAIMRNELHSSLQGLLSVVEYGVHSARLDQQRHALGLALSSAKMLVRVVNEAVDTWQDHEQTCLMEIHDFQLLSVVEDVLELSAYQAQMHNVEVLGHCRVGGEVRGDQGRVQQILMNLVTSVIRFASESDVVVSVLPQNETDELVTVLIEVSDAGPGLPDEVQARLVDEYGAITSPSSPSRIDEAVLSLSVARRLVEWMGGTFGFESRPGEGTRVWATLSLTKVIDSRQVLDPVRSDQVIAIVDAHPGSRVMLYDSLRELGIQVLATGSFEELEDVLCGGPLLTPSAVLVNLNEDNEGGTLLHEWLGQLPSDSRVRTLLDSGIDLIGMVPFGRSYVSDLVTAVITKPVRQEELEETIRQLKPLNPHGGRVGVQPSVAPKVVIQERSGCVLVVEDNLVQQQITASLVERIGYQAEVVSGGMDAFEAVAYRGPYCAILMDCQMPGMDGYETTGLIRRWEDGRSRIPIVAFTVSTSPGDEARCLAAGMDAYVSKEDTRDLDQVLGERIACLIQAGHVSTDKVASSPMEIEPVASSFLEPVIDHNLLVRMQRDHPQNHEFVLSVCQAFREDVPARFSRLRDAMSHADAETVSREAHGLRGSARAIGARRMARLCGVIEEGCAQGPVDGTLEHMQALEEVYPLVLREIDTVCQTQLAAEGGHNAENLRLSR